MRSGTFVIHRSCDIWLSGCISATGARTCWVGFELLLFGCRRCERFLTGRRSEEAGDLRRFRFADLDGMWRCFNEIIATRIEVRIDLGLADRFPTDWTVDHDNLSSMKIDSLATLC